MRKQYDDFIQLKQKDMSKTISDMTFKYINPETQEPTRVPPAHYEKILDQVTEKYMGEITSRQFLTIMFNQLSALKKEDEKYFQQALLCMDIGLNPKDLRIDEQIALTFANEYMEQKKKEEKKEYHFLSEDIVQEYNEAKNNPRLQTEAVKISDIAEEINDNRINRSGGRDER